MFVCSNEFLRFHKDVHLVRLVTMRRGTVDTILKHCVQFNMVVNATFITSFSFYGWRKLQNSIMQHCVWSAERR